MGSIVLNQSPIDLRATVDGLSREGTGAVATFEGIVRPETRNGVALVALYYHAYEEMAAEQMQNIRSQACARFDIVDASIVHRLGHLKIGEASIVVAVSAAHRAPAFDACRWIVDTVKSDVPIWKQDRWSDGANSWVEPN
ncbi:MAG: molybdenum cofactor biosynthesis protein MoaE [Phycisphaerae bacterium]|nr:molybdenum cofactor biosynthesis protein MoaE [Phycisphaerae bacterium]